MFKIQWITGLVLAFCLTIWAVLAGLGKTSASGIVAVLSMVSLSMMRALAETSRGAPPGPGSVLVVPPSVSPLEVPMEAVTKPSLPPEALLALAMVTYAALFTVSAACTPGQVKAANDLIIPVSEYEELHVCLQKGEAAGHRKVYCDCAHDVEVKYGIHRDGGTKACPEQAASVAADGGGE